MQRVESRTVRAYLRALARHPRLLVPGLLLVLGPADVRRGEKELDHLTEQHVHGIDEAMKNKEAELLEV